MPAGCLPPRSKRTWTFACDLLGYQCRRRGLAFFLKRKALFHVGRLLGHLADRMAKLGALLSMDVVRVC